MGTEDNFIYFNEKYIKLSSVPILNNKIVAIGFEQIILIQIMLVIRGQECQNIDNVLTKEWTESNNLGSYISQNLLGHINKPYHSLLTVPDKDQFHILISGLIEEITIDSKKYQLNDLNLYETEEKYKHNYLEKVYFDNHPHFIYNLNGVKLLKSIILIQDQNVTIINYQLLNEDKPLEIKIKPLISIKKHTDYSQKPETKYSLARENQYVKYINDNNIEFFIHYNEGQFHEKQEIIKNLLLDGKEDYISIGHISHKLNNKEKDLFIGLTNDRIKGDLNTLLQNEIQQRNQIINKLKIKNELYKNIITSSRFYILKSKNHFLIKNNLNSPIISNQAMINSMNIPFCLREYDGIKENLRYLANQINQGLIPEKYSYQENRNIYNNLDNSFWYLQVLFKFIEFTGDWKFVKDFLWEKTKQIFHFFHNNHIENVTVDYDGLLLLNSDYDPHPSFSQMIRYSSGKNLALNILWYNAIKITELFSAKFADIEYHTRTEEVSHIIKKNFYPRFYNKEKNYFNNCIDIPPIKSKDTDCTPYALFMISLPFEDLTHYKTKQNIMKTIKEKLLTPYGLRTLAPDAKGFTPNFNPKQDESAHKGVIHPYLIFHYLSAHFKMNRYSKTAKKDIKYLLVSYEKMLKEGNVGYFPQYVNSLPPYKQTGQSNYSVSMAEYLRVRTEELGSF